MHKHRAPCLFLSVTQVLKWEMRKVYDGYIRVK